MIPGSGAVPCPAMSGSNCPVCSGLALNDSSGFVGNPTGADSKMGFASMTCNYGNPLSGDIVSVEISCFQDSEIAKQWTRYYQREIPYPYPETGYGSGMLPSHEAGHRVMTQPVFGPGGTPIKGPQTFEEAYQDWGYANAGRFMAKITSQTPADTITYKEAEAINIRRIGQFTDCFSGFSPTGNPSDSARKTIKGTVTGSGMTKAFYNDLSRAIDDAVAERDSGPVSTVNDLLTARFLPAKPLRHVKIVWKGSQAAGAQDTEFVTATDANGNFEIPAMLNPGSTYQFDVEFTYRKGDTDFFSVSGAGIYDVMTWPHAFEYKGDADLRQDVNFLAGTDSLDQLDPESMASYRSNLYIYDETANALEFYQDHLGSPMNCNLPLAVNPFWPDRRTKFEIDSGRGAGKPSPAIVVTPADSSFDNPIQSQYIIFHEFSHYAMYCIYGKKFPASPADNGGGIPTINHGGYMNPSTSDSFTEGFAEFMPAVMEEYYGNPLAGYAGTLGSIDEEYQAWEYEGKAEEHAVSSTLWNLYATDLHYTTRRLTEENIRKDIVANPEVLASRAHQESMTVAEYRDQLNHEIDLLRSGQNTFDEDHPVKLRFEQIWTVLRTYNRDFTDVYTGLVAAIPAQKAGIDTVFADHGFYRDTGRGNGTYDPGEPWRPVSGGRTSYAAGDPFIDLPHTFRFQGSETVGSAGDYRRTTRRSSEPLPGHFIRTTTDVPLYIVSVEHADRPWKDYRTLVSGQNNRIPVPVPPPGENAQVNVIPVGVKYGSPLSFRSEEFNQVFPASAARGYYVDHDFRVSGPVPARTVVKTGSASRIGRGSVIFSETGPAIRAFQLVKAGDARGLAILLVPLGIMAIAFLLVRRRH